MESFVLQVRKRLAAQKAKAKKGGGAAAALAEAQARAKKGKGKGKDQAHYNQVCLAQSHACCSVLSSLLQLAKLIGRAWLLCPLFVSPCPEMGMLGTFSRGNRRPRRTREGAT